ncbi:uncharacterized protein K452DRAFT_302467 [Aplosporella prunicola CBS 121167]|uniref:Uncharacterized protein n=1 Tax=Aplosporella prunicola CBS 121167 TaxID=1176127 RepID=A0A6A6B0L4_9PEZI|nr:uncharacterized protein K452DRAFT_302467 [Aplosporella prunicola CBS 121167]KAF2136775.1 hypothetical protein K452DRAFT_302467 [Aplosporella prunicola CBS 121167]
MTSRKSSLNAWLATSFGCCASASPSDDYVDQTTNVGKSSAVSDEQPRPLVLPRMQTYPKPSGRGIGKLNDNRPWTAHGRSASRPTIGAPTNFRKVDGCTPLNSNPPTPPVAAGPVAPIAPRRRSFRPLELSIYFPQNKLSPLPDFTNSVWTKQPEGLAMPPQAVVKPRSDSGCDTGSLRSSFGLRKPVPSFVPFGDEDDDVEDIEGLASAAVVTDDKSHVIPSPRPTLKRDSVATINSASRLALERATALPAPPRSALKRVNSLPESPTTPVAATSSHTRSNTEPIAALEKAQAQAQTQPQPQTQTQPQLRARRITRDSVDAAIRELNSIVSERRRAAKSASSSKASSVRASPASMHVPAIAPNYKMHVRSETLEDIGSAFSMPLASNNAAGQDQTPLSQPLPSVPASPSTTMASAPSPPQATTLSTSTRARLAGWFRRAPGHAGHAKAASEPFYALQPSGSTRSATAVNALTTSSTLSFRTAPPFPISTTSTGTAAMSVSTTSLPETLRTSVAHASPPCSPREVRAGGGAVGVGGAALGLGIRESYGAYPGVHPTKDGRLIRIAVVPPTPEMGAGVRRQQSWGKGVGASRGLESLRGVGVAY